MRLRSDVDRFKQVFRHPNVQSTIAKHKISLRRAFRKYTGDAEGLTRQQFHQMARDCKWSTKSMSHDALNDIFRRVQSVSSANADVANMETLDLNEWLECICAVCVYHNPNPFVPR